MGLFSRHKRWGRASKRPKERPPNLSGVRPKGMGLGAGMPGAQYSYPLAMTGPPGAPSAGGMPPGFGALAAGPGPGPRPGNMPTGPGVRRRPPPSTPADIAEAWSQANLQTMMTGNQFAVAHDGGPVRLRPGYLGVGGMGIGGPGTGPGGMGAGGPGLGMGGPPGGVPGGLGGMGPMGMGGMSMGGREPGSVGLGLGGGGGGFDAGSHAGY
ncbi:hypothetical protein LTR53_000987 [Teratosphaeriaceae sp. CCFEE 6253]|nr:hypothetical protein LTR53_000987 [Teratosphaeriaceae sp. CCFEE 6253]